MNKKGSYTEEDRKGIARLVGAVVCHPVDCADADFGSGHVYQIMPGQEVER